MWRSEVDFGYILYLTFILDSFFTELEAGLFSYKSWSLSPNPLVSTFSYSSTAYRYTATHPALSIDVRYIKLCLHSVQQTLYPLHHHLSSERLTSFFIFPFVFSGE